MGCGGGGGGGSSLRGNSEGKSLLGRELEVGRHLPRKSLYRDHQGLKSCRAAASLPWTDKCRFPFKAHTVDGGKVSKRGSWWHVNYIPQLKGLGFYGFVVELTAHHFRLTLSFGSDSQIEASGLRCTIAGVRLSN